MALRNFLNHFKILKKGIVRSGVVVFVCLIAMEPAHSRQGPARTQRLKVAKMKRLVIPVDRVTPKMEPKLVERIIPTDLKPTHSSEDILTVIADRSVNYWLSREEMQSNPMVRATKTVSDQLRADVVLKASSESKVKHVISMNYDAFQSLANLDYRGWLDLSVHYHATKAETRILMREKVLRNKALMIEQTLKPQESATQIGLGWSW